MTLVCAHCRKPIDEENPPFEVTTWTQRRRAGGFHTLVRSEPTGRYAHRACLDLIRSGHVPGQSALFDA